jgi:hypothetical protein
MDLTGAGFLSNEEGIEVLQGIETCGMMQLKGMADVVIWFCK